MGLLPWSFGFLFVFSLLLWTQLKTITETSILQTIALTSMDAAADRVGVIIEQHARPAPKERTYHHRTSPQEHDGLRTTKLHVPGLFEGKGDDTQKKIFSRLILVLYGNQPIFSQGDNSAAVLDLFDKVCKKGEETGQHITFSKIEDLALISLREDPSIPNFEHSAYYHMLRGGRGELLNGFKCKLEGLQYYISLRPHNDYIMSVYLAPKNLLLALFGPEKEDVVTELLAYRQEIWKQLRQEKGKNKDELQKEFKEKYSTQLPPDIDAQKIDFDISTTQPHDSPRKPPSHGLKLS